MLRLKDNFTMEEALAYLNKSKTLQAILAVVLLPLPFIPPYFLYYDQIYIESLVFDPRDPQHTMYFFLYLAVYFFLYLLILGKISSKRSKVRQMITEKAIILGCPIEIKPVSGGGSYKTTVLMNEGMKNLLLPLRVKERPGFQKDEIALQEPYIEKIPIDSGVSGKFLGKNIPNFANARKIGMPEDLGATKKNED